MARTGALIALLLLTSSPHAFALGPQRYVAGAPQRGGFSLIYNNKVAALLTDPNDWPGVIRAAHDLRTDIGRVAGKEPDVLDGRAVSSGKDVEAPAVIIVGTIGRSGVIDRLVSAGKIDVSRTAGKWESFFLEVVPNPLPGVKSGLVIAGSDKRGTIYGIYDLCEQIGVSPWHWWADVPVRRQHALFVKPGKRLQGEPSVKYRGIFLNDEAPDLSGWVAEKFGHVPQRENPPVPANVANYNSAFYAKVFELILRLKGNYLWPAMWNNAFNEDDPDNARLADEYGVVVGTSHQEPMLRAQKEWDRRYLKTQGRWNYYRHPDLLKDFWREGIRRNRNFESVVTIGLRGADDTPMIPGGTVADSMALLEEIVAVQRKMIADEINPDVTRVPQLWCLYKEVQEYYKAGLRVPDDVTLLWADDNWGNIRRLPTAAERKRPGGAGVYYHFDYVGGPRNYKWINTNPLPKIWEQMTLAKEYGADRIWIVNVGHLKGLEIPIEYFMHLAWNTKAWTNNTIDEYTRSWAAREFGAQHAREIAEIVSGYARYNGRRKPELLAPTTYSLVDYGEADRVVADFDRLAARAEKLYPQIPENARDAFYQLVLFPAKACAQVNALYVAAGKNALYAQQGRAGANDMADRVEELFKADADLMDHFNHRLADGRWNHFMDQVHIGYTMWNDPPRNIMPRVTRISLPAVAALGVAVEGSGSAWPAAAGAAKLPRFDPYGTQQKSIEIFNRGQTPFDYRAISNAPWIVLSRASGKVVTQELLRVSVNWRQAPEGIASGMVTVSRAGGESVSIAVESFKPAAVPASFTGFIEGDGYVAIEAEHYANNVVGGGVRWEKIEGYGRTLSGMSIIPVTAPGVAPPANSPRLEYRVFLHEAGEIEVSTTVAPTLNFTPDRGLSYAISLDDEPPRIVTVVPAEFDARNGNREWEESVRNACRIGRSAHKTTRAGEHVIKIWMVDPALVLERIVLNTGGLKPTYLGPPESIRKGNTRLSSR